MLKHIDLEYVEAFTVNNIRAIIIVFYNKIYYNVLRIFCYVKNITERYVLPW